MKKCNYCGRENEDGAHACRECGTRLAEEILPPAKPLPWKALRRASWLVVLVLALGIIYFLSFGPVTRYFTKVTRTYSEGEAMSVSYQYPNWVWRVYYPAHWLSLTEWGHLTYGAYLRWWEPKERADSDIPTS